MHHSFQMVVDSAGLLREEHASRPGRDGDEVRRQGIDRGRENRRLRRGSSRGGQVLIKRAGCRWPSNEPSWRSEARYTGPGEPNLGGLEPHQRPRTHTPRWAQRLRDRWPSSFGGRLTLFGFGNQWRRPCRWGFCAAIRYEHGSPSRSGDSRPCEAVQACMGPFWDRLRHFHHSVRLRRPREPHHVPRARSRKPASLHPLWPWGRPREPFQSSRSRIGIPCR